MENKNDNNKIYKFISNNFLVVVNFSFVIFIVFWLLFFITPKFKEYKIDQEKIELLREEIRKIRDLQYKTDTNIVIFNEKISKIDSNIIKIRDKKTIIEKIEYETNTNISTYNNSQIDSFFSNRYGY